MDWRPPPLEPNLKFVSELKDDLKEQYYERHEKAQQSLANFSYSLQSIYLEHQKVIAENIELSIITEKLKKTIKEHESNRQISDICNKPYSEVMAASSNCKLEVTPKAPFITKTKDKGICGGTKDFTADQKENINEFGSICTADFDSPMEEEIVAKNKSPARPVADSLSKVQNSPVLSKTKRHSSKKSNSSYSNNSLTSSNDSRVSFTATPIRSDKNSCELANESDAESDREPLHGIENKICTTPKSQSKCNKVLSVSKIDYGKTEFTEGGRKLRQSKLTLKRVIPLIDISKVDSSSDETFFNNESTIEKKSSFQKNLNDFCTKNESKAKNLPNQSACEDELIETSPAQSETSKLRNKLNMKKPEMGKLKLKHFDGNGETAMISKGSNENDSRSNFKVFSKMQSSKQKNEEASAAEFDKTSIGGKRKSFDGHKTLNDETYFSPAELANKNHDLGFEINSMDFEDEMKTTSPPAKKMLMSSFDVIPGRMDKSPEYAYKEAPVRKKAERAQLPGWSCRECEKWYGNLPEKEKRERQKECSKHRGKYKANISTPDSFWNPVFDEDDNDSSGN